jgi:hypothetical protein
MKLRQITVSIENSSGRLHEVTQALADADINLRALTLVDTGDFGQLRLLVSDIQKARRIMMKKHLPARVDEVVAVEIEDKPGSLANMLKPILHMKINVLYAYAFIGLSRKKAVMIFRFSDNDKAIEVLKKNGIRILDAKSFGILDTKS